VRTVARDRRKKKNRKLVSSVFFSDQGRAFHPHTIQERGGRGTKRRGRGTDYCRRFGQERGTGFIYGLGNYLGATLTGRAGAAARRLVDGAFGREHGFAGQRKRPLISVRSISAGQQACVLHQTLLPSGNSKQLFEGGLILPRRKPERAGIPGRARSNRGEPGLPGELSSPPPPGDKWIKAGVPLRRKCTSSYRRRGRASC